MLFKTWLTQKAFYLCANVSLNKWTLELTQIILDLILYTCDFIHDRFCDIIILKYAKIHIIIYLLLVIIYLTVYTIIIFQYVVSLLICLWLILVKNYNIKLLGFSNELMNNMYCLFLIFIQLWQE